MFVAGLACIASGVLRWLKDSRAPVLHKEDKKEVLDMAKINRDWQELVKNNPPPVYKKPAPVFSEIREPPIFCNPDIEDFYRRYVYNNLSIKQLEWAVICRLLELLDQSGGCPSVVSDPNADTSSHDLKPDAIDLLAHIPLWKHALAVAVKMLGTVKYGNLAGSSLIVALAHDVGKIPEFHIGGYSTSDHPLISMYFLRGIPEFNRLPNSAELLDAVRNHHFPVKEHTIAAILKDADQEVRKNELCRQLHAVIASERITRQEACGAIKHNLPETHESLKRDPDVSHFNVSDYSKPLLVDISGWFKVENFIAAFKESVNRVTDGWWDVVSTPNGYLFCSAKGLFKLLCRTFPLQPDLLAAHANTIARQDILFTVVMTLASEYQAVATELLGKREYLCPMIITSSSGKAKRESYMLVPLKAEALGLSGTQLEVEKSQTILRMVKSIVPLQQEPETKISNQLQSENDREQV
jgi:HD domain-containing protein